MYRKRKVIAALVLLVTGLIVTFIKGDIPDNLLSLMEVLYSAFVFGNIGQHAAEAYVTTKKKEPKDE